MGESKDEEIAEKPKPKLETMPIIVQYALIIAFGLIVSLACVVPVIVDW